MPRKAIPPSKTAKCPQTTGRTDGQTYYTATQRIWTRGLRPDALRAIMSHALWSPKSDVDDQKERHRDRQTDRHIISTGIHWVPLDPSVGIKYYCRYYTVEPMACVRMHCAQLQDARFDCQKLTCTTGQRDREIERQTGIHISSTGPHWVPKESSVGIN